MVDIQSPTAEIKRGKKEKEERQKKPQDDENIMFASATQSGHNYQTWALFTTVPTHH